MILAHDPLAHQAVRDRQLERFGQRDQLRRGARRQHAAAGVEHRALGLGQRGDDPLRGRFVDGRTRDLRRDLVERVHRQAGREDVHRHVHQDRTRPSRLREMERALHDARQIARVVDAIDALAERTIDLELVGVLVKVDLLVRMTAVEVRLHVAGDHHHRDRVERGVGDAGRGVGEPGAEMGEQHAGLSGGPGVAVRRVRRDLLVPGADVADAALAQRVEHPDHGMAGQAEHHLDAEALEVVGQQIRREAGLGRRRAAAPE